MTYQGVLVLNLLGFVLLFWVLNLIRRGRLYVGYGIIFVFVVLAVMLVVSIPRLLMAVTHLVGAIFPTSALTLLALCFLVFMLIYVLTQVTIVTNRLTTLVQELAVLGAAEIERKPDQEDEHDPASGGIKQ